MKITFSVWPLALIGLSAAVTSPVHAREPGALLAFNHGANVGAPLGYTPPPGLYASEYYAYYNADLVDNKGNKTGSVHGQTSFLYLSWSWPTEWTTDLWGASGSSVISTTFTDMSISAGGSRSTRSGFSNIGVFPVILGWNIAPDLYFRIGGGAFVPTGRQKGQFGTESVGDPFWSPVGVLAISYLGSGYNLSATGFLELNTENKNSEYTSGSRIDLEFTATKKIGSFDIGPVLYYSKQITSDKYAGTSYAFLNNGRAGCNSTICTEAENVGVGGVISYNFEAFGRPMNAKAWVVTDAYARATTKATTGWFSLSHSF